jgi:hypothetical protein
MILKESETSLMLSVYIVKLTDMRVAPSGSM